MISLFSCSGFHTSLSLFLFIAATASALETDICNWPNWGGSGYNLVTEENDWNADWPPEGPLLLWKQKVGIGFSPITTTGEFVYTAGSRRGVDTIYCFDRETGEVRWRHSYSCDLFDREHEGGPVTAVTLAGGKAYTLSRAGDLYCLNAQTGEVHWSLNVKKAMGVPPPYYGFTCSPIIEGEEVIVDVGMVLSLNRHTGEVIWRSEEYYGSGYAPPIPFELNGRRTGAFFNKFGLVVLDLKTGAEITRFPWNTEYDNNIATPICFGNKIFITSGYNVGCALLEIREGKQPEVLYKNRNMRAQFHSCVYYQGYIFGFDGDYQKNEFRCLEFETGEVQWSEKGIRDGSVIVVGDRMLILTEKGEVIVAVPTHEEFREIARAHLLGGRCWTPPTLSCGFLYLRNSRGDVACYDLRRD